jgi:hypothetical protein
MQEVGLLVGVLFPYLELTLFSVIEQGGGADFEEKSAPPVESRPG